MRVLGAILVLLASGPVAAQETLTPLQRYRIERFRERSRERRAKYQAALRGAQMRAAGQQSWYNYQLATGLYGYRPPVFLPREGPDWRLVNRWLQSELTHGR